MSITCPKPVYIGARLARRFLPDCVARRVVSSEFAGPDHIANVFRFYAGWLSRLGERADGRTFVEVGSGLYGAGSLGFLGLGAARVVLVDPARFRVDPARLKPRLESLSRAVLELGGREIDPETVFSRDADRVLLRTRQVESVQAPIESLPLANGSADVVLSNVVLEYVRNLDAGLGEMARCMKKGAIGIHRIDFRDGFHRYPFDMLRYSRFVWERLLTARSGPGGYQNRVRLGQMRAAFVAHGLSILDVETTVDTDPLTAVRPLLHPEFRTLSDEDLATIVATIAVRKE